VTTSLANGQENHYQLLEMVDCAFLSICFFDHVQDFPLPRAAWLLRCTDNPPQLPRTHEFISLIPLTQLAMSRLRLFDPIVSIPRQHCAHITELNLLKPIYLELPLLLVATFSHTATGEIDVVIQKIGKCLVSPIFCMFHYYLIPSSQPRD
jgi:hypothetical protein